jgi:hypothetical protein
MKTNRRKLVMQAVQGAISHPKAGRLPFRMNREGKGNVLPGTGGISYNVRVGDPAFGLAGDHIEPGVSMKISDSSRSSEAYGLGLLACIGNKARVVEGEAKGAEGIVAGLHGGINHVIIDFDEDELDMMKIGDEILVKAYGQGLEIADYPEIKLFNLDPDLLEKMSINNTGDTIEVPVVASVPARLMGSGIGASTVAMGDYDITTGEEDEIKELGLDQLKLGDLVYLKDCDNTYGREYKKGAGSIGIVIHSDCIKMGHGPGVTTLMTCKDNLIKPVIDEDANIANYFALK